MGWPTTKKFLDTIAHDHFVIAQVDLLVDGELGVDLSEAGLVANGDVNCAHAAERRSGLTTLVDPDGSFIPRHAGDLLAPAGNELRLWRGALFNDGSGQELVPIGTFRFTTTSATSSSISLDLHDRSWVISGSRLEQSLTIPAGTSYITAITSLLVTAYGSDLQTNFPDTDEVTATMVFEAEADPWEVAQELAANLGMRLFFDPMGVATIEPEPDPALTPPVWSFSDLDPENFALPGLGPAWDATNAINAVIVIGENTDTNQVFRGVAYDLDPNSPTQYGGRFGRRPFFIRDDKIVSQAQADLRAKKELDERLGVIQTVTIPSLVNPAFEVGDIAYVRSDRRGVDQIAVFERFTVPQRGTGTMTIETRSRLVST